MVREPNTLRRVRRPLALYVGIIMLFGTIGILVGAPLRAASRDQAIQAVEREAEQIANLAQSQISRSVQAQLWIAAGLTIDDDVLSHDEFSRFVEYGSDGPHELRWGIAVIELLDRSELAAFDEREIRLNGARTPVVLETGDDLPDWLAMVTRTHRVGEPGPKIGIDLGLGSQYGLDVGFLVDNRSRDPVVLPVVSEIVTQFAVLAGTPSDGVASDTGLLMVVPARFGPDGAANTWVVGVTTADVVLEPVLGESFDGGIAVSVVADGQRKSLASRGELAQPVSVVSEFDIAGLAWEVRVVGTPDPASRTPLAVALGGFVFGALVAVGLRANFRTGRLTEQKRMLDMLAHTDSLTQLPNRAAFSRFVADLAPSPQERAGILVCDLNDFKSINDVHGHEAGDAVLCVVAERLRRAVRSGDLVARWGGDEFLVVVANVKEEEQLNRLAESLSSSIAQSISYEDQQFLVSMSVGIAQVQTADFDISSVLAEADKAMYGAKADAKRAKLTNSSSA